MISIKTPEEIELMRESALIVSKTLGMLTKEIKPGVTTLYLDKISEAFIRDHGAVPGFLGLYDFPNTLCMSPNAQVVHGIPNDQPLEDGDIISIDCGALKNGFYGDHAYTFEVGDVAKETKKLLEVTKQSLYEGIREFKAGNYRKYRIDSVTGEKYVHTLDAQTGYPAKRDLLSATVYAPIDCADADGYATAFMAMGLEKTKVFLKKHPELSAFLIYVDVNGNPQEYSFPEVPNS